MPIFDQLRKGGNIRIHKEKNFMSITRECNSPEDLLINNGFFAGFAKGAMESMIEANDDMTDYGSTGK